MFDFIKKLFLKNSFSVEYYLNDPSTPQLKSSTSVNSTDPKFSIIGWNSNNVPANNEQKQIAQTYVYIEKSLETAKKYLGFPIKWQKRNLTVFPKAGVDFNAYYDRDSLKFFYNYHPVTRKAIYMCESFDVVSHETGHAVLDSLRSDLWNLQSLEVFAFHESFADMFSIITLLHENDLVNYVLNESQNDLQKDSCINKLGEEVGIAIHCLNNKKFYPDCMRKANVDLKYVKPEKLPPNVEDLSLSSECHNFSRVLTSAWYECLVETYNYFLNQQTSPFESVCLARDICGKALFDSAKKTQNSSNFFILFVKNLINSIEKEEIKNLFRNVFLKRNMIQNLMMKKTGTKINETKKIPFIDLIKTSSNKSKLSSSYFPSKFLKMNLTLSSSNSVECYGNALTALRHLYITEQIDLKQEKKKQFYIDSNNDLVRFRTCCCERNLLT